MTKDWLTYFAWGNSIRVELYSYRKQAYYEMLYPARGYVELKKLSKFQETRAFRILCET